MKKMLASCLTCCALFGSMCFSSPIAQLHAMSTEGGTGSTTEKFDHDIELNIKEDYEICRYTVGDLPRGTTIYVSGSIDGYDCKLDGEITRSSEDELEFKVPETAQEAGSGTITFTSDKAFPKEYNINVSWNTTTKPNWKCEVDISERGGYFDENRNNIAFSGGGRQIIPTLTTAEVKPGDTFSLNLPEYFLSNKFSSTSLALRNNAKSDFIEWDKITSNSSVTGTITADAEAGKTISFDLKAYLPHAEFGMTDYNPTLVTYNSETPGDLGDVNEELEPDEYLIPVEFKIVDDGKGDIIDEDEVNVFITLTPEYKKLTEKGETYKLDASVELDEDADSEAKESFEAMKKDGHFKVSFATRDLGVATVSEDGTVTAVANGSTEIVAYVEGFEEDGILATSKVDVEIAEKVEEEPEEAEPEEADTTYPKTGDNFMAISAAILTLGISALVIALISKKQQQEDVNEEK